MPKGLAERNVAELTLIKKEAEKKRQRHTLAGLIIQALMGHADAKMTKHYQEGHTEKGIEYLEVGADLAF